MGEQNLPHQELLAVERRTDFINICVPLTKASMKGDWKTAKRILDLQENLVRCSITENCDTSLHIAASQSNTESIKFVQNLVGEMERKDLQLVNRQGNTALSLAAAAGNVEIARIMVKKNEDLPRIPNGERMMPLDIAVSFGNLEMVVYLYEMSQQMGSPDRTWNEVFLKCIKVDLLGK